MLMEVTFSDVSFTCFVRPFDKLLRLERALHGVGVGWGSWRSYEELILTNPSTFDNRVHLLPMKGYLLSFNGYVHPYPDDGPMRQRVTVGIIKDVVASETVGFTETDRQELRTVYTDLLREFNAS